IHFAQHGIDESGGGTFLSALDQFDALGHRGVGRDTVEIAQLKDAHAEGDPYFVVKLGLLASREMLYEVIELGLIAQAAKGNAFGQGEISRIARFTAEQIGGISTAVDALEYSEGNLAGGRHSF